MELLVKLYNDKPSRLAVYFDSQFKASKQYEAVIEKYNGYPFHAKIELINNTASLTLISSEDLSKIEYKGLKYRAGFVPPY